MASKQTNKQATSAAKTNNPARKPEHQPRKRISRGRSKSAAIQTSSAAGQEAEAPEGASESIDLSTNTTPSPEHQASQSKPPSEGADLATPNVPGADRPPASTKRAVLIGMLERPQGRVGRRDRAATRLAAAHRARCHDRPTPCRSRGDAKQGC